MATVYDRRSQTEEKPVWQVATTQMSWANGAGHAAQTETIEQVNGTVKQLKVVINNPTNNPTTTVALQDLDGTVIYTTGALAKNTTTLQLPTTIGDIVFRGCIVSVDPSADAGATSLTVDVTLRGI